MPQTVHTGSGVDTAVPWVQRFFPEVKRPGLKLIAHLHLVPRLRMTGAVPLLPLYLNDVDRHNIPFVYFFVTHDGRLSQAVTLVLFIL